MILVAYGSLLGTNTSPPKDNFWIDDLPFPWKQLLKFRHFHYHSLHFLFCRWPTTAMLLTISSQIIPNLVEKWRKITILAESKDTPLKINMEHNQGGLEDHIRWFVGSMLIFQGAGVQECHFCCGLRGTQFNRLRNCRSQNIIKKSLCFGCCSALRWSTFF